MKRTSFVVEVFKVRALIVFGTRYRATIGTSEEIAVVLREEGLGVRVANAKKEKIKNLVVKTNRHYLKRLVLDAYLKDRNDLSE